MSETLFRRRKRRLLWLAAMTLLFVSGVLAHNTEPVQAASTVTEDGYTVNRTYSYGSFTVAVTKYDGTDTALTLPAKATISEKEYTVEEVQSFLSDSQRARVTSITIPEGYTSIDVGAFRDCTALQSVTIPSTVTSISSSAFAGCTSLKKIQIADGGSALKISNAAFSGCTSLETATLPSRLKMDSDGTNYFYGCSALKEVSIPGSENFVTGENGALYVKNETGLTLVTWPEGSTTKKTEIPDSVRSLQVNALGAHSLRDNKTIETLTVPASVTTFQRYCVNGCSNLKLLVLKAGTPSFEDSDYAFANMADGSVIQVASEEVRQALAGQTNNYTEGKTQIEVMKAADPCDLNGDGKVNLLDIGTAQKSYKAEQKDSDWDKHSACDLNGDGTVDLQDLTALYNKIYNR
ncbi:MAG: leucine-rich repeat protein [Clostridiales bacterium]|uniref:leucine-rich repeat protein n=1 Tax=Hornefia butyriciproducens TaxID=2652293 RepID=UPI002A916856|nr:leucine-rich repeat protein [Hornefia butyriciproducens]MCI7678819.1 leucine-rich repeat protein [Clostridiales bacterium]MDY5463077.1 leucine-rich repeat protein [Hornefia butyriciproducens]